MDRLIVCLKLKVWLMVFRIFSGGGVKKSVFEQFARAKKILATPPPSPPLKQTCFFSFAREALKIFLPSSE